MFSSINAALNSLDMSGPHQITVTGVCAETVQMAARPLLTIQAPTGKTAEIIGQQAGDAIVINGTHVILRRLVLTARLSIGLASVVRARDVQIERSPNQGLTVTDNSVVGLDRTTISGSAAAGIRADRNSTVLLAGPSPESFVRIQNNSGPGINSDGSAVSIFGGVTIENNGGAGIVMTGGRLVIDGTRFENVIQNNGGSGLGVSGARANLSGQNAIRNNRGTGIAIGGGVVSLSAAADGRVTTIEGHVLGVNVAAAGSFSSAGPNRIRNNGSTTETGRFVGGIRVGTVSRIQFDNGTEVTNNSGFGIFAELNAAMALHGTVISNNRGHGVSVLRNSTMLLTAGTITGNTGASISCDTTGLVTGDVSGISGIQCMRIERENGPPRPGAVVDRQH